MNAPLFKYGILGDGGLIFWGLVLGFGFGFFLESGGFGNSKKIAGVFIAEDWRVFKMMFTIIVTAMILTFGSYYLGMIDISVVQLASVNLWPLIVGSLIFGVGMAIGGYCPGTSVVAIVTRKLDGLVFVAGGLLAIFVYAEAYPLFSGFTKAGSMGKLMLTDVFGGSYAFWVFLITVFAVSVLAVIDRATGKLYGSSKGDE